MTYRGALGNAARRHWMIHVPGAVLFVPEVALLFENSEHRSHGRSHRRIGQTFMDLRRRQVPVTVDEIHDLSLTAAELRNGHGRAERVEQTMCYRR